MRSPLPPVAAVIGFVDAINRGDVDRLVSLMSPDHRLQVLQEPPVIGRDANREAWDGYATAFPNYVIYPDASCTELTAHSSWVVRPVPISAFPMNRNASSG